MDQVEIKKDLRILMLEDTPSDAELMEHELRKANITFTSIRVETRDAFVHALEEFHPDIILSDYKLPNFNGMAALEIVRRDHPEVPVVMVTGALSDIDAVDLIHAGAIDYVLKDRLARLAPAVQRALSTEQGIRARKMAEEKFRKITESAQDAVIIMTDKRISFWNKAAERIFGYTAAEAIGQELHALITPPQAHAAFEHAFPHFQATGTGPVIGKLIEVSALRKGGEEFPVELSISATQLNGQWHAIGIARDITDRKQTEVALKHALRALATLGAVNRHLVHATDEVELMQSVCQTISEQHGYRLAWVGYVQHDEDKSIKIMAHAGHDDGYLATMQLTWADTERGQGPTGRTVRSGITQLCQDIASAPLNLPWRDEALKRGYASSIGLALKDVNGEVFGILTVYAEEAQAFTADEIKLLEEMAGDLAFGVQSLRTRRERDLALEKNQQQLVQLQDNLEDTVRAIATIVEMRDPYTSGHQIRVAELASAIAKQMGLPDEQVHAIHLAGVVHDLGKIQIPAEILSKPGKITDLEYRLIKTHAQAGYDILKGIDFPWPIAQMVLQHHERMDGSGYPQGLKGDQILLEARILGVADVVEAMSSHRPYRASLGIEVALEEITRSRGTLYDPQVVDACLALFREQHYAFKS
jgi:PAS domain S-box-containing protein/putative nucleotidyltransferase with HDIG domain